jgi:hypothetical protein
MLQKSNLIPPARVEKKMLGPMGGPGSYFIRGVTQILLPQSYQRSGLQSRHSFDRTDGVVEPMAGYGV